MSWLFKDPVVIMKEIMSWLLKDPINSGLAQLDHAQSNSKKWLKKIAPNEFCPQKTSNKISTYLLAPFILQNFYEKILIQSYVDVGHFWDQNSPFVLNKVFWCKPLLLLSSTCWPFSLCKIFKKNYNGSRIMTMHHFWAQSGPFAPPKIFFENYYYHSHLPISPFHCAKFFTKFFNQMWQYAIYEAKIVHFPK